MGKPGGKIAAKLEGRKWVGGQLIVRRANGRGERDRTKEDRGGGILLLCLLQPTWVRVRGRRGGKWGTRDRSSQGKKKKLLEKQRSDCFRRQRWSGRGKKKKEPPRRSRKITHVFDIHPRDRGKFKESDDTYPSFSSRYHRICTPRWRGLNRNGELH